MGDDTDVVCEGWVSKKKGNGMAGFFQGPKKRYCKLKVCDTRGILECYDSEVDGKLLTRVKITEAHQPEEDTWIHIKGFNDVKAKDTYILIQGDPQIPGDTELWYENLQDVMADRTDLETLSLKLF